MSVLSLLLNIAWIVCGGLWMALGWIPGLSPDRLVGAACLLRTQPHSTSLGRLIQTHSIRLRIRLRIKWME
jgi:uncharacterized membrane protein YccF (DUF307 family)